MGFAGNKAVWPIVLLLLVAGAATLQGQSVRYVSASRIIALTPALRSVEQPPVVTDVAIQPAGDLMATVGDDHLVRIWDLRDGRLLRRLASHSDWVRVATFSPDGNVLATAGNDRRVIFWDPQTGRRLRTLTTAQAISSLVYSPDGKQLATAGFGSQLWLHDSQSGDVLHEFGCECQDMRCVAFSPQGDLLAAAGRDGHVHLWRLPDGQLVHHVEASRRRIRGLTFTHDGRHIVTAGEDRVIRVFAVDSGAEQFQMSTQPAKVLALVAFAPGRLATAGSDNQVRLWDLEERCETARLSGHTGSVAALDFNDEILVSGSFDTTVRIWPVDRSPVRDDRAERRHAAAVR
jgi:WD40 repeat protein